MSASIASTVESLRLTRDAWIAAYKSAVTTAQTLNSPKPDYGIDGQSVSWQAVYTNGPAVIASLTKVINELSWSAGPVDTWWKA